MKYSIDKSKIVPGLVIHTTTFEQMQAICECTTDSTQVDDYIFFEDFEDLTCVYIQKLDYWNYNSYDFYEKQGYTITPLEDLLIPDWKTHLSTTKSAVTVSNIDELTHLANFLGFTNGDWNYWLSRYPNSCSIRLEGGRAEYCSAEWYKANGYTVYNYSDILPMYQIGEQFMSSNGNLTTITKYNSDDNTYDYTVSTKDTKYHTTEFNITQNWTKIPLHSYNPHTDEPIVALDANPTKYKEKPMNNTTLKLLLTLMGVSTETPKDATNSNYIGIITNAEDAYVGYVYANTIKELKEIIAKSENEGNTIHCFKFQDSYKQATRPVVKVTRSTTEETPIE